MSEIVRHDSLDQLAHAVRDEHRLVLEHAGRAVEHALRCGEALRAAHATLKVGEAKDGRWGLWLSQNAPELDKSTAYKYMRLAHYAQEVRSANPKYIKDAMRAIDHLPRVSPSGGSAGRWLNDDAKRQMLALHREGDYSLDELAEMFGVSTSTAWYWVSPKNEARRKKAAAKRKAQGARAMELLERSKRDEEINMRGGTIADGYSLLRRATQAIDRAHNSNKISAEQRVALSRALNSLYRAEDEIAEAVRASYGAILVLDEATPEVGRKAA